MEFPPRQWNEVAYHGRHAVAKEMRPLSYEVLQHLGRKWWNHDSGYAMLAIAGVRGRAVLVPGCGDGQDAIRCAKIGTHVRTIDLSSDISRGGFRRPGG